MYFTSRSKVSIAISLVALVVVLGGLLAMGAMYDVTSSAHAASAGAATPTLTVLREVPAVQRYMTQRQSLVREYIVAMMSHQTSSTRTCRVQAITCVINSRCPRIRRQLMRRSGVNPLTSNSTRRSGSAWRYVILSHIPSNSAPARQTAIPTSSILRSAPNMQGQLLWSCSSTLQAG